MQDGGRILGIDYGSKRIGVALSDPTRVIAQSLCTLEHDESLYDTLEDLIREHDVVLVIVGLPYAPDGGLGRKGKEVMSFIDGLREHIDVPVETWDESFTTVEAHKAMIASGMKKKARREKTRVDAIAAQILLQEYLESSTV